VPGGGIEIMEWYISDIRPGVLNALVGKDFVHTNILKDALRKMNIENGYYNGYFDHKIFGGDVLTIRVNCEKTSIELAFDDMLEDYWGPKWLSQSIAKIVGGKIYDHSSDKYRKCLPRGVKK
jgi:hypothetical protein